MPPKCPFGSLFDLRTQQTRGARTYSYACMNTGVYTACARRGTGKRPHINIALAQAVTPLPRTSCVACSRYMCSTPIQHELPRARHCCRTLPLLTAVRRPLLTRKCSPPLRSSPTPAAHRTPPNDSLVAMVTYLQAVSQGKRWCYGDAGAGTRPTGRRRWRLCSSGAGAPFVC